MADDNISPHISGRLRGARISQDQFNKMLFSYRTSLMDHTSAARAGGVSYGTAKKAFERGMIVEGVLREPISTMITRELNAALVELDRLKTDQKSRTDTVVAVERELVDMQIQNVQMSRGASNNAMAALAVTSHVLNGAVSLANRVSRVLDDPAYNPSPREAVGMLRTIAHLAHFTTEIAKTAKELDQNVRESTDLRTTAGGMTAAEAQEVIQSSGRSAARIARAQARAQALPPASPGTADFDVGRADIIEGESAAVEDEEEVEDEDDDEGSEGEAQDFDHR